MKDVVEVEEDNKLIIISHPVRNFILRAPTCVEHTIWITGLLTLCQNAKLIRDGEVIPSSKGSISLDTQESKDADDDDDDNIVWSKQSDNDGYDEFRNGPQGQEDEPLRETSESRLERAARRAGRRMERNAKKSDDVPPPGSEKLNGNSKLSADSPSGGSGADYRSEQYQLGNGNTANTRITNAISASASVAYEETKEEEEEEEEEEDEGYSKGGDAIRQEKQEEAKSSEECKEQEDTARSNAGSRKDKKDIGPPSAVNPRKKKTGKFKFGTGMNNSPEFKKQDAAREASDRKSAGPPPNTTSDSSGGPEYDSDDRLADDEGLRMEEMTLAEGDRAKRRMPSSQTFASRWERHSASALPIAAAAKLQKLLQFDGLPFPNFPNNNRPCCANRSDTPAKGALSVGNRRSSESKMEDEEDDAEEGKVDEPRTKRTAADDEEFWGVEATNPENSILGERCFSKDGVSFRFDSDSDDDEEIDIQAERNIRLQAVLKAEREAEERMESKEGEEDEVGNDNDGDDDDDDNDDDDDDNESYAKNRSDRSAEKRKRNKSKKGRKNGIGSPPVGPPPGKSKKSKHPLGPPPTSPPPRIKTGLTPDKNFLEENWDDSPTPVKVKNRSGTQESKCSQEDEPISIRADHNFVDDDWD